jgi:dienelactone hydrolase
VPRFADVSDAELVTVPVALLPSGDEDKATIDALYAAIEKKNPGNNFLKWYPDQVHGWAAARGNVSSAC